MEEYLEILCDNNHLPNQLHLSSEIDPFEVEVDENLQIFTDFPNKSWACTVYFVFLQYKINFHRAQIFYQSLNQQQTLIDEV
mgnify:CR=1 FL=1